MKPLLGQFEDELILRQSAQDVGFLSQVPAKRGVYALFTNDGTPIIAVIAADMRASLANRLQGDSEDELSRKIDLSKVSATVKWVRAHSRLESDLAYLAVVRQLWPDNFISKLPRRKAWFIALNDCSGIPHFITTGKCDFTKTDCKFFGPFITSASADKYIELLTDMFDLCRYNSVIRRSPYGQPCAYAQMGRCHVPCDGTMDMADYRKLINDAENFILGDSKIGDELTIAMTRSASQMHFEQAAVYKGRLESLQKLGSAKYSDVRSAESLKFIIVQRGGKKGFVRIFRYLSGAIEFAADVKCPPQEADLQQLLDNFSDADIFNNSAQADPHLLAIVVQYLYSSHDYAGLVLHTDCLDGKSLAKKITDAGSLLSAQRSVPQSITEEVEK